jgi:hypothetical protein
LQRSYSNWSSYTRPGGAQISLLHMDTTIRSTRKSLSPTRSSPPHVCWCSSIHNRITSVPPIDCSIQLVLVQNGSSGR